MEFVEGGSGSPDHDLPEAGPSVDHAEAGSGGEVVLAPDSAMAPQLDLEEVSSDDSEEFQPGIVRSDIQEGSLERMRVKYRIPPEFILEVPLATDRACNPPPGRMALYREALVAGLRFPIFPFFFTFFNGIRLPPCAVTPNTIRFLCAFTVLCHRAGVRPSVGLFLHFFTFSKHRLFRGWWYASPRRGRAPLIQGNPSSVHNWKSKFFFVSHPDVGEWDLPPWEVYPRLLSRGRYLSPEEEEGVVILRDFPVPNRKALMSEESLIAAGLFQAALEEDMDPADMAQLRAAAPKRPARASSSGGPAGSSTPRPRDTEAEVRAATEAAPCPAPKKPRQKKVASAPRPSTSLVEASGGRNEEGEEVSAFDDWDTALRVFNNILRPADVSRTVGDGNPHHRRDAITSVLKVCHFVSGYCSLRGQLLDERKNLTNLSSELEVQKRLTASLQEERKNLLQKEEENRVLIEDLRGQITAAGPAAVEAYKVSKECHAEKIKFAQPIYNEILEDCCRRVSDRYPDINPDFLYELEAEDGTAPEPAAPGAEGGSG